MLYLSSGAQGSRSPRAVSDIRGGHRASHGPEGLASNEALNRLTRAPWALGQGQRKASFGLRKFKETQTDRELGQRSLANSCPSGTCGLTAGILWNMDATGVPSGTDSTWRTGTSLRYVLGERWEDAELPDRNFHHAEQQEHI